MSQPTFVRIARRLGFEGFAQLKSALKEAQSGERDARLPSDLYQHMNAGDDPYAIASQIIKASIQSMEDLLCVLDREQFNGTVEALLGARRIGFYGVGDAKIVAESAYHKFNRMGAVCDTSNRLRIGWCRPASSPQATCACWSVIRGVRARLWRLRGAPERWARR